MSAARHFKKTFLVRNLRRLYIERIKDTGAIGLDRMRPSRIEPILKNEIELIAKKVSIGNYSFTAYKEKLISKGQGVPPRVVSIPTARDRIVLRALCEFLGAVFPEATLDLPQVAIDSLSCAISSGQYAEFVKIDLQNFYPSIPHEVLFRALKKRVRKPEALALLKSAIETPTVPESKGSKGSKPNFVGIPQGLAISNLLAEIALLSVDAPLKTRTDIWYRRYVDDILILTPAGESKAVADEIIGALTALGLTPHALGAVGSKSKTAALTEPFTFLGYEVANGSVNIRRESVLKFESSLASIFTGYRHKLLRATRPSDKLAAVNICRWKLNLRITGCIFEGRRLGWVFYFSQITTTNRLRAVSRTIESLLRRFNLSSEIRPKSLIKTYYESRRKNKLSHHYIPNFDTMSVAEQREILSLILGATRIRTLSDKRVAELFRMRISAAVRELEADLSGTS